MPVKHRDVGKNLQWENNGGHLEYNGVRFEDIENNGRLEVLKARGDIEAYLYSHI